MLPFTFPWEAFFVCPPLLLRTYLPLMWSPLFPSHVPALILLSLVKVRLSLTSTLLITIWCFEQTVLFLFLLARTALAYLPTALVVKLRPHFPFRQAQYAQVSLLKSAPFCMLFTGLGSMNESTTSLFLLSDCRSVFSSVFSFTLNSLADLAKTVFFLLLFYQNTISTLTLVSFGERCG